MKETQVAKHRGNNISDLSSSDCIRQGNLLISIFNSLPMQKRNLSRKNSVIFLGALLYAFLLGLFPWSRISRL